ncbi:MAG: hypothetical protein PVF83_18775 [Anaerolineales bacterium]|jgi:hypothetical protein
MPVLFQGSNKMRQTISDFWKKIKGYISYLISGLGLIVYAQQSWALIHTQASIVFDESAYIVRGFLLASGDYWPYADYGLPMGHMPLSFLIPGYIQELFDPGIRTARYFTFGLGILSLIGMWIAARKLGGKWWAAVAVWAFALNPGWIESYSLGYSQVIILFFTTWSFVFLLGEEKKDWEIILASFLIGLAGMTRLNVLILLFLLIIYIFWQHGRKAGFIAMISGLTPIIILHALYWPGILKLWAYYVPDGISPYLDTYRFPLSFSYLPEDFTLTGWLSNPNHVLWDIVRAFWKGILKNIFAVFGVLSTFLFWPKNNTWKSDYHRRLIYFLLTIYLILFLMHAWAALTGVSCNFTCFKGYLMFFTNIGIFITILSFPFWEKSLPVWRNILIGLFITYILIELAHWNQGWKSDLQEGIKWILNLKIPRLNHSGLIQIKRLFEGKFGISQKSLSQSLYTFAYWGIPLSFVWIFIPALVLGLRKYKVLISQFAYILCTSLLILFLFLSPLKSIGGELNTLSCDSNVIDSHEAVGEYLNSIIPEDAKVYWAIKSWMLFLYIQNVEIFPPQTNNYSFFLPSTTGLENDFILRFGYWNFDIMEQFLNEADFLLVEGRGAIIDFWEKADRNDFEIIAVTDPFEACRGDDAIITVYKRINPAN